MIYFFSIAPGMIPTDVVAKLFALHEIDWN